MEDDFSFIFSYDLSGGQESWYHDVIKGKLPIYVIYVKNPDSNFFEFSRQNRFWNFT